VYLPQGTKPLVAEGQTATAGETVIADLKISDNNCNGGFRVD
jgi:phosphatidylserine decarboxylase